jgi:2-polyprenyl-3-methyl-5-hydroxy-6-metoxy-1,4-benzoquinol methylase
MATDADEVERLNDAFAREHDIDDYYARASFAIRFIEQRRLAIIEDMVAARPGARVLEVGCGGGHVLSRFRQARLTGVDVSGEMLARAEKNLAGYDVELKKGELGALDLPERSFDAIICTEVLEHAIDPEAILAHIRRLAAPHARVVITFPNDRLINGIKRGLVATRLTRLPPLRRIEWGGDHYHLHVWSVAEMRDLLRQHFGIEREAFSPSRLAPIRCCFLCSPR